jgi:hypothetical protein
MVLVHLYYENVQFGDKLDRVGGFPLGKVLGEYTRFAAGGFVLVSGLAIGAIFLPKALAPGRQWATYRHLIWRSIKLLGWQYMVAILWALLGVVRTNHPPITSIPKFLLDVLLLREGDDLLPLYVLLIAASPILLAACTIKWGRGMLAAASIGLFVLGRFYPIAIAAPGNFPPLLWQIFFVAGFLCGSLIREYDQLSIAVKQSAAIAAWVAFGLLFWAEYWKELSLPAFPIDIAFSKKPLTTGEMLRYMTAIAGIMISTDLIWRRLAGMAFTAFSATLGRSSLVVYVVHIFLMEAAGAAAKYWAWMGAWQLTFIPASLAILWLVALIVQWPARRRKKAAAGEWPVLVAQRPMGD